MRCRDFLALYSDYRDGLIVDPAMGLRMKDHLASCQPCARHHAALEFGTQVLRRHRVDPSDRFLVRLRCRLALAKRRAAPSTPVFGWPVSLAATMLVAAVIVKGVAPKRQAETPESQAGPSAPELVQSSRPATAVRARFQSPPTPDFRPPPFRYAPARLNLDSALDLWHQTDSSPNYFTVHATFTR